MKTLSIVIPVFNEVRTIAQVLERVRNASSAGLEKELDKYTIWPERKAQRQQETTAA